MGHKIKLPKKGIDGFYGHVSDYSGQETEKKLRENVASKQYSNYLDEISIHHSIPVIDTARLLQFIYQLFGKKYHLEGNIKDSFFLRRVNKNSRLFISEIFGSNVKCRYTEILFLPELGLPLGGKEHSVIGKLDSQISRFGVLFNFIARQKSFHINKP